MVQNHERRYKKTPFCVPTVPKTGQNVWIPIASVRILADFRTDAMLKNISTLQCYAIQAHYQLKIAINHYKYKFEFYIQKLNFTPKFNRP